MRSDLFITDPIGMPPIPTPAELTKTLEVISTAYEWPLEIRYRTNGNVVVKMTDPKRDRSFQFTGSDHDEAVNHVCLEIGLWIVSSDRAIKPGCHLGETSHSAWEREHPGSEIHSRIEVLNRSPGDSA